MDMKAITKQAEDKIDIITATSIEVMELIAKASWNEAIEHAAKCAEYNSLNAGEIRRLKK